MTIDLFKYLPLYYRESRIMKALMDALGRKSRTLLATCEGVFANTCPDEGFWLWLREYDAGPARKCTPRCVAAGL